MGVRGLNKGPKQGHFINNVNIGLKAFDPNEDIS